MQIRKDLCDGINSIFTDMKNLEPKILTRLIEALSLSIELSVKFKIDKEKKNEINNLLLNEINEINDNNKEGNQFNYKILFYSSKILTITILNIDKIYILFEPFVDLISQFMDNKLMVDFSLEILYFLITQVLINYEKMESNIKKNINEENKIWIEEKWQKSLFSRFLILLSQPELYTIIKNKFFNYLKKIIQQSVNYLDSFGWESIIQSYSILSNYDIENTFLSIKELLNDYKSYLSLFNIIPIINILKFFIFNKKDIQISLNSIDLFTHCANLISEYRKGKRKIKDKEKIVYANLFKEKNLKEYCDEIFIKLFSYLNKINDDERIDIKKTGINTFTKIFESKINIMSPEVCLKLINDIFFKIFVLNIKKYKSDIKTDDAETIIQTSLKSIVIILRTFFKDKEEEEKENNIFEEYLKEIIDLVPFGSPSLNTEILQSIIDIKFKKKEKNSIDNYKNG